MNTQERKERFIEIITAVELFNEESDDTPRFPNNTKGLADGKLRSAIVAHAFHEGEDFSNKLVNALMGSAVTAINDRDEGCPTDEDMSALGLASSIAWAHGESKYLFNILGLAGQLMLRHDIDLPLDFSMIFRPNKGAKEFGKFNPYDIMDGKVTDKDLIDEASVGERLEEMLGEDGLEQLKEAIANRIFKKFKDEEAEGGE